MQEIETTAFFLCQFFLSFTVSSAKFVPLPKVEGGKPEPASDVECPNSLCKWLPVGTLFRLNEHKPNYFVTCTNGGSVCRKCQEPLVFNGDDAGSSFPTGRDQADLRNSALERHRPTSSTSDRRDQAYCRHPRA